MSTQSDSTQKMSDADIIRISESFKMDLLSFHDIIADINDFINNTNRSATIDVTDINRFTIYYKCGKSENIHEFKIISYININCSYKELYNIFHVSDDYYRSEIMKQLYKGKFVN